MFHNIWARLVASLGVLSSNFEVLERLLFTTVAVIRLDFVITIELEVVTQLNDLSALLNQTMIVSISLSVLFLFTTLAIAALITAILRTIVIKIGLNLGCLATLTTIDLQPLQWLIFLETMLEIFDLTLINFFVLFVAGTRVVGRRPEYLWHHGVLSLTSVGVHREACLLVHGL